MRHEEYMRQAAMQSDSLEQAGKEAYGNVNMVDLTLNIICRVI